MRVRTPFRCSPHPCEYEIAFVSDVEGDLDYFNRWVAGSRCVAYTGSDEAALTLTHARAYFVYGGDVPDHGRGSEQLLRLLVGLKRAFPRRVALLVGNRDLNKLRLTSECAPSDLARPHWSIPAPHWDASAPTLSQHLEQVAAARGGATAESCDCAAERLRWMYENTLGCPATFEARRAELAALRSVGSATGDNGGGGGGGGGAAVSDEEVVAAAVADVMPGGAMSNYLRHAFSEPSRNLPGTFAGAMSNYLRHAFSEPSRNLPGTLAGAMSNYLRHACVAAVFGQTLFAHGAVDARTAGYVPDDSTRFCLPAAPQAGRMVDSVSEWVDALNGLLERGLADHAARPEWDALRGV
ncbi:hypothetical protein EMIHUDRAFT_443285 [Emiliania huxleyi CCMP1516]|uniref:Calcineurin-like phosphoesterase domain-containing protein n=2 Tax=Emiliania huxleyi TaxID=2903 RepID=A0A0D3JTZ3_EMIH1|nr:hypothetical protein EMIHUDRAFT_443285 [Emiliania huxleyi CCMP1516]EOD26978.1 hypothetical protein EMIHUDRAFT_443285 [Emiliania huxleyi CCMP1516]|eukprot:XP_005779407.1 hypothetical protein EMIHUDRAFT_443285 [Emiliania huxleyi CCMP1516]